MQVKQLITLLENFKKDEITIEEVIQKLRLLPYEALGNDTKIDHHRALRSGFPEVVFAEGKMPQQIVEIVNRLATNNSKVLVTRLREHIYQKIQKELAVPAIYYPTGMVLTWDDEQQPERKEGVLVLTAGTADVPIAEEAAITAEMMGNKVERIYDVGVAGIHRLFEHLSILQKARVIIVVAGMEGALPSVVGGLVSCPVIAVPTSIGYGTSFGGLTALLAMLNSCASGVAVMNIDNGFGAGALASKINLLE